MTRYVIADPTDNCITLSKSLYKSMRLLDYDSIRVFCFKTNDGRFGFTINPLQLQELKDEDSIFVPMMYDSKGKTIGFESRNPTVNRMFYEYGLPIDKPVKLSVTKQKTGGMTVYLIERPKQ